MGLAVLAVVLVIAALALDEWWRLEPSARAGLRAVLLGPGPGAPARPRPSWRDGEAPSACAFLAAVRFAAASLPEEALCPAGSRCEALYADSDYVPTAAVGRVTGVSRNQIVPSCAPSSTPPAPRGSPRPRHPAAAAASTRASRPARRRGRWRGRGGAAAALAAGTATAAASPRGACGPGLEVIGQSGLALLVCACVAAAGYLGVEGRHHILSTAVLPSEPPYARTPHHKYALFAAAFAALALALLAAPIASLAAALLPLSAALLPGTSFVLAALALAATALLLALLPLAFFTGHFFVFVDYPEGFLDRHPAKQGDAQNA
eukprot:tig00000692_g3202.t1